jgi:hypothetical protein
MNQNGWIYRIIVIAVLPLVVLIAQCKQSAVTGTDDAGVAYSTTLTFKQTTTGNNVYTYTYNLTHKANDAVAIDYPGTVKIETNGTNQLKYTFTESKNLCNLSGISVIASIGGVETWSDVWYTAGKCGTVRLGAKVIKQ